MAKTYEIASEKDFVSFSHRIMGWFEACHHSGKKFEKLNIVVKKFRPPKTSQQHRKYWACIHELKKAFQEVGYTFNENDIHSFVKRESGFTETVETPDGKHVMVTKSIADNSDDSTSKELQFLIDWMIRFSVERLGVAIDEVGK